MKKEVTKIKRIKQKIKDKTARKKSNVLEMSAYEAERGLREYWAPHEERYKIIKREEKNVHNLSVVIPVYNNKEKIKKCIESVVNQKTEYSMQLILIDDGSTDGSGDEIDKIAAETKKDGLSIVIEHQRNAGAAAARNRGLEIADGEYLMFVDSDDYLIEGIVQTSLDKLKEEGADIVQMQYYICNGGLLIKPEYLTAGTYTRYADMCKYAPGFSMMKIYKRELFKETEFPVGYWFEDSVIHLNIYPRCKKMIVMPEYGYVYFINPNGVTRTHDGKPKSLSAIFAVRESLLIGEKHIPCGYMDEILKTFGKLTYNRIKYLPEDIIKKSFIVIAYIVTEYSKLSEPSRENIWLVDAFKSRDYGLWRWWCCKGEDKVKR